MTLCGRKAFERRWGLMELTKGHQDLYEEVEASVVLDAWSADKMV